MSAAFNPARSQSVIEVEPNDTPATAGTIKAPATLLGTMNSGDQDAFNWIISDQDAGKRWNIELHGIPGRLTILQTISLDYDDTGELSGKTNHFKMGSRDGSLPSIADGLIFEPGEYLLGLAYAGGNAAYRPPIASANFGESNPDDGVATDAAAGGYRVHLVEADLIATSVDGINISQESARKVALGRELSTFLNSDQSVWYRIDFGDAETALRWDIQAQIPVGRKATARLISENGTKLTDGRANDRGLLSLPDLALPTGTYYLELTPILLDGEAPGFIHTLHVNAVGQRIDGGEAEPNDIWRQANRVDLGTCCSGQSAKNGDKDVFAFSLDEDQASQLHNIVLTTAPESTMQLCLLTGTGAQIQCRKTAGVVELSKLLLPPGDYGFQVVGGQAGTEYRISINSAGEPQAGIESEPNDKFPYAIGTPSNNRVKGTFDAAFDIDYYKFVVTDEAQLWRVQVIGDSLLKVAYYNSAGTEKQSIVAKLGARRVRLENIFLLPGIHRFSVSGRTAGDYTLLARALGQPDPNGELESNDDNSRMQLLRFGQTRTGLLAESTDTDMYRFYLADWDHIRMVATPAADGQLQADLAFNGNHFRKNMKTIGPIVLEGLFPPGDYQLSLSAAQTSDAEYSLSLERLDRFACPMDCEPNDRFPFANPIPTGRIIKGSAGAWTDYDWYRLPVYDSDQDVTLTVETSTNSDLRVFDKNLKRLPLQFDRVNNRYAGTIPAGDEYFLRIGVMTREGDYSVTLLYDDETAAPAPLPALPVELKLTLDADEVAAYERIGQRVPGTLVLQNNGSEAVDVSLTTAASDGRWTLEFAPDKMTIAAGASESVAASVVVPTDAWADIPVRIGVQAKSVDERRVSTFVDVNVGRETIPVNPEHSWAIPEQLRGGLNVARGHLGASAEAVPVPANFPVADLLKLFDGMAEVGHGPVFSNHSDAPVMITTDLIGEKPVPVAGFALNPLSQNSTVRTPRDLLFQLSLDGINFEPVASGTMTTVGVDQFFVLDSPQTARFARLLLPSNWSSDQDKTIALGEWKVIATPGFDPFDGEGMNLADIELGGHVVWSKPRISANWDDSVLTPDIEKSVAKVAAGEPLNWVVGFHNNRAAQIERIDWIGETAPAGQFEIDELALSVSLDSPSGPWQLVSEWVRSESGNSLQLDTPVWARFLRFSVASSPESSRVMVAPETLKIWERPTDSDYYSALSEWGFRSSSSFYESTLPVKPREQLVQRGNETRATADALDVGVTEAGLVRLGEQSQWYRPVVDAGHNTLMLSVAGDPTVRSELGLTNGSGDQLPLRKIEKESSPTLHVFEASIEAGEDVHVEVREPPRNVMFLWDTSPSVGKYRPMIDNSLIAYSEDLVPGRDMANLLPFGSSRALLKEWHGEPYLMQTILNDHPRKESSSSAEHTQFVAARDLAPREGTKSIVVISDAKTPRFEPMWDMFNEVRPRVFAMRVPGGNSVLGSARSQDLMQDWARVNGGHYTYLANEGDMEVAFDRASTLMRRPANYTLTLASEFREAPGPGFLQVTKGTVDDGAGGAVELILDASGSMWQRLDGRFRIDIAKEVLTSALNEKIPAGTPTVLRAFGHRKPNTCDTDVVIPLAPLNKQSAAAAVTNLTPQSLAKTPIAASLAAVARDLGSVTGSAVVVLVTDGEETCGGNPAAEIEKLKNAGFSLSLNIVGFAIDDDELSAQFEEWAKAGGGRYFAANDADGLSDAVGNALATPYSVYDSSGTEVSTGVVGGEPVELEQGVYRVVVTSMPAREFKNVVITGAAQTSLEL